MYLRWEENVGTNTTRAWPVGKVESIPTSTRSIIRATEVGIEATETRLTSLKGVVVPALAWVTDEHTETLFPTVSP